MTKNKYAINQINIIRFIVRNGKQSKSSLSKKLNKNWSEINDSIKLLLDKKLIEEDSATKNAREKFFNFTLEGFKVAIDDKLKIPKDNQYKPITSEQFWKNLSNSDYSIQKIKKISNLYEERILKIDKSYLIPKTFLSNINNKESNQYGEKPKRYEYEDKTVSSILKTISKYKPTKLSRLLQRLESMNIEKNDLDELLIDGLLVKINDTYDLSHAGLIELFFFIYRDSNTELDWKRLNNYGTKKPKPIDYQEFNNSNDPEAKIIVKELDRLRLKYVDLLPDIFNGDNFHKLRISFYEIVVMLMKLYKNLDDEPEIGHNNDREDRYSEEYQTLQRLDRSRQDFEHRKMSEHLDISEEVLKMVESNFNVEMFYITNWIYFGDQDVISELVAKNSNLLKVILDNKIQRKITFDFYCIYKAYCEGWNDELKKSNISSQDSKIKQWHDQEIRTLLDFSKNYIKNIELSLQ